MEKYLDIVLTAIGSPDFGLSDMTSQGAIVTPGGLGWTVCRWRGVPGENTVRLLSNPRTVAVATDGQVLVTRVDQATVAAIDRNLWDVNIIPSELIAATWDTQAHTSDDLSGLLPIWGRKFLTRDGEAVPIPVMELEERFCEWLSHIGFDAAISGGHYNFSQSLQVDGGYNVGVVDDTDNLCLIGQVYHPPPAE